MFDYSMTNINNILHDCIVNIILQKIDTIDKICKLDENKDNLLGIHDSWIYIPLERVIFTNNGYWDCIMLTDIIMYSLNKSLMENPYPQYPCDPYTKKYFMFESLVDLFELIKKLNIKVNISIIAFYENLNDIKKYIDINGYENITNFLIKIMSSMCRFKMINNKDSQNSYNGIWVDKTTQKSNFEYLFELYKSTSMQLIVDNYIGQEQLIENPRIKHILLCMDEIKTEDIELIKDRVII